MDRTRFRKRCFWVLAFFSVWGICAAGRLVWFTIVKSSELKRESRSIAWRCGKIPAIRGKILDRTGIPLVWTELHHDLVMQVPPWKNNVKQQMYRDLAEAGCIVPKQIKQYPFTLVHSVKPEQFAGFADLCRRYPELLLQVHMIRKAVEYPEIRSRIGSCRTDSLGQLTGESGLELQFDPTLSGKPGSFKVMLDKTGAWFFGTLQITEQPQEGTDVTLNESLQDLLKGDRP